MQPPVIYYVFDVLCGWCYGFSPVITEFWKKHREDFEFRTVSGGMILGEREGPIGEVGAYIKDAHKQVETVTGVRFGDAFFSQLLEPGEALFSSLPGALAMATFRQYQPDNAIPFAARMQEAIYQDGLPPAEAKTYGQCAEDFGMNAEDFIKLMVDKDKLDLVRKEFKTVHEWNIKGFPAVIYQQGDKGYLLTRGYTPLEELEKSLEQVKKEA